MRFFKRVDSQSSENSSAALESSTPKRPVCSKLQAALNNEAKKSQGKDIFLRRDLFKLFTIEKVSALLQCGCQHCEYWRLLIKFPTFRESDARKICDHDTSRTAKQQETYTVIFSLLVYLGIAPFIYEFLKRDLSDEKLQENLGILSQSHLLGKIFPERKSNDEKNSLIGTAEAINKHKHQFFIRTVDDQFEEISSEDLFPFLEDEEIGGGHCGTVFKFRIDPDYLRFAVSETAPNNPSRNGWFARKVFRAELRDEMLETFRREWRNLERIKDIGHPHLMKYHKAFIHGRVGVIIFPLANSDLRKELDQPCGPMRPGNFRDHPFWSQLLGVAKGLRSLHNFEVPDSYRDRVLFGYHFDLKPANILIGHDGTFMISDFGQAHFLRPEYGEYANNSIAEHCGGDPSYAPPENETFYHVDGRHSEKSRMYDIWCLGCIFLEVLWYVVKGRNGSEELDYLRNLNSPNDKFFYSAPNVEAYLKKGIVDKTKELKDIPVQVADRDFIHKTIGLIFKMLDVKPGLRPRAANVVTYIESILDSQASTEPDMFSKTVRDELSPAHSHVGSNLSTSPKTLCWIRDGEPLRGELRFQRSGHFLSGTVIRVQDSTNLEIGEVQNLLLVPFFALYPSPLLHQYPNSDIAIFLKSHKTGKEYADRFEAGSQPECQHLLGNLLGQKIICHLMLTSASFVLSKKAKSRDIGLDDPEQARSVQIWVDGSHAPDAPENSGRSRSLSYSSKEPVSTRLVIYMHKSIFVFTFSDDFEMNIQTEDMRVLEWIPRGGKSAFFRGLVLERSVDQPGPGIPMHKESLEDNNAKFSLIRLAFQTLQDRLLFGKEYFEKKKEWREQRKHHERRLLELAQKSGLQYLN